MRAAVLRSVLLGRFLRLGGKHSDQRLESRLGATVTTLQLGQRRLELVLVGLHDCADDVVFGLEVVVDVADRYLGIPGDPFPDDTRIFLREWSPGSVSQNGLLGSEPARPVLVMHIPKGGDIDAKRTMLAKLNAAVSRAFHLPDFATFLHEHTLDTVVVDGRILADDLQRVEDQEKVYGATQ